MIPIFCKSCEHFDQHSKDCCSREVPFKVIQVEELKKYRVCYFEKGIKKFAVVEAPNKNEAVLYIHNTILDNIEVK